jgi:threonine aldolase
MNNFVDLRSDTVTRPTPAMLAAMMAAPLGDDVFGDDPTVLALQERVAAFLGKEVALFVPSGTMANQLAVRVHCRPGDEAIVHSGCHIHNFEGGAAAAISGVTLRTLNSADGTLDPREVAVQIHGDDDPHLSPTRLICFENTHNACGGVVVPQHNIREVALLAQASGVALHLDGARLCNAAVATGLEPAVLAAPFATVSMCFSKGLGAPVGSVLAGPKPLIDEAKRWRKRLGGGMRQAGILAAAGLHALDHHVARLADDHRRAKTLALAIADTPGLQVNLANVQTNLVFFDLDPSHPLAAKPSEGRLELIRRARQAGVLLSGGPYRLRAVTHLDVDDPGIERAIAVLRQVLATA